MKTNRIRILVVAALALAAGVCVSPAAAQSGSGCKGSFKLSNEVRWQGKVLPAGDYSFLLKSAALPAQIVLRGPRGAQIFLTSGLSIRDRKEQSFLTIERRGGSGYVRELYLAPLGTHFHYQLPKIPKEELLAQGPPTTERVSISAFGK